jgi:hypothetical protein
MGSCNLECERRNERKSLYIEEIVNFNQCLHLIDDKIRLIDPNINKYNNHIKQINEIQNEIEEKLLELINSLKFKNSLEDFKKILIQNKDNISSSNISEQLYNMTFDNFNNYINIISAINEQNINQFGTLF